MAKNHRNHSPTFCWCSNASNIKCFIINLILWQYKTLTDHRTKVLNILTKYIFLITFLICFIIERSEFEVFFKAFQKIWKIPPNGGHTLTNLLWKIILRSCLTCVLNFYPTKSCFRILISIHNLNQYLGTQFKF